MIPIHATPVSAEPTQARDVAHYMRPGVLQLATLPPLSLYVHLPWCVKKCPYCDFNSHEPNEPHEPNKPLKPNELYPQPHSKAFAGLSLDLQKRYVDSLFADLEVALPLIWGRGVHTIFIGGGTPSLFDPQVLEQLISGLRARLRLEADCEITMEANPGTFERDRFRAFAQAGITRLSVGVQSFNDTHLNSLGRIHNGAQALAAVAEAALAFSTFNIDLMYALPQQTPEQLNADLDIALGFNPPHLSVYQLTLEPNTYFAKYPPQLPPEDDAYAMLDCISERTAAAGMDRYEVSAYAKAGHRCRHNLNYWEFGDYLGIGAGAHSKLSFAHRVVRQVRIRDPLAYMAKALQGNAVAKIEEVRRADLPFEYMLNALRLREGFALQDFADRTGLPLSAIQKGLRLAEEKTLIHRDFARVWPSAKGFDFLNDLQGLFLE